MNRRIRAIEISLVCRVDTPLTRTQERFVFNLEIEEIVKGCIASYGLNDSFSTNCKVLP